MAIFKKSYISGSHIARYYNVSNTCRNSITCKLLIVGGGAGGCSVAWRMSNILDDNNIIVLEPSKVHYFQPLFSLVASGIKDISESRRPLETVLPRNVLWLSDYAENFDPHNNVVHTRSGREVHYEYMVVSVGLKNDYDKIPGLKEELDNPSSRVTTIYSSEYCEKVWCCLQQFRGGHAVFTFPKQTGKCPGAAQKIMYLADDYWRKNKIRDFTSITYNTATNAIFGMPAYRTALEKVASTRNIIVNCNVELIKISGSCAVFISENGQYVGFPFNFLHVSPPMSPPTCLTRCKALVTDTGYLDVDRSTLQHKSFPNVYGIGDCTNTPNSKTAAAVAPQSYVVASNLANTMRGLEPSYRYGGYGACPILTSYRTGMLAEFQYDNKLCSTFPFDQSKERRLFYNMQTQLFPYLYWNRLIKGKWNGPSTIRKIINPFTK